MDWKVLLDAMDEVVYVIDPETYQLLYLSEAGRRVVGNYEGKTCYKLLQGIDKPCPYCIRDKLAAQPMPTPFHVREFRSDYLKRNYILKAKMIEWNGKPVIFEEAIDITEKEQLSEQTRQKLAVEETLLKCSQALLRASTPEQNLKEVLTCIGEHYQAESVFLYQFIGNEKISNTYQWSAKNGYEVINYMSSLTEELIASWMKFCVEFDELIIKDINTLRNTYPNEYRLLTRVGVKSVLAVPLDSAEDNAPAVLVAVGDPKASKDDSTLLKSLACFVDIFLEKQRMLRKLYRLSYQDTLTGLYNRNKYKETISELIDTQPEYMGVAVMDINGLRKANELDKFQLGDSYLKYTAQTLKDHFPEEQVFRIGGDKFIVLSPNISHEAFEENIGKIRRVFDEKAPFSVSIGYTWSDRCPDVVAMEKNAEHLLIIDKQSYYLNMEIEERHRSSIFLTRLLEALREGRFKLFLQAKHSVAGRKITGAEALIRYEENGRVISPDKFIPLLEKELLVRHVDFYIFREVCRTLRNWLDTYGWAPPISVNFSRTTLMDTDFYIRLIGIWEETRVPRELIELEVTESADSIGMGVLLELMNKVRDAGFKISLDDFGSQYTNLRLATEMSVDSLKIDRSLIQGMQATQKNLICVKYLMSFCKAFSIQSIAEGVETEEQFELLKGMGCDVVQGYLFCKPIPVQTFEEKYLISTNGEQ